MTNQRNQSEIYELFTLTTNLSKSLKKFLKKEKKRKKDTIKTLIDFNVMSIHLGLFYTKRLGNSVH